MSENWNKRPHVNQYMCMKCGGVITTLDIDPGTTPMLMVCKTTDGCVGSMRSLMYKVDQTLKPNFEFYMPSKLPTDPQVREHVKMGGLLLRKSEQ